MAPKPKLLISSSFKKKKEHRYACLSEAKASRSQRMWAAVSSPNPHFLHKGLSTALVGKDGSSGCYDPYGGQLQP